MWWSHSWPAMEAWFRGFAMSCDVKWSYSCRPWWQGVVEKRHGNLYIDKVLVLPSYGEGCRCRASYLAGSSFSLLPSCHFGGVRLDQGLLLMLHLELCEKARVTAPFGSCVLWNSQAKACIVTDAIHCMRHHSTLMEIHNGLPWWRWDSKVECCSQQRIFPTKVTQWFISNSHRIGEELPNFSSSNNLQNKI
jgi:hypothetical protein